MIKHYELTFTVSKNISSEEVNALFERVISYFPQATASEKGYDFFTFEFYSEPEAIAELEKKLKSEPQIKKYLLVKKEAVKPAKIRRMPPAKTPLQEQKVEKVELKEIDKKLKEIFGE